MLKKINYEKSYKLTLRERIKVFLGQRILVYRAKRKPKSENYDLLHRPKNWFYVEEVLDALSVNGEQVFLLSWEQQTLPFALTAISSRPESYVHLKPSLKHNGDIITLALSKKPDLIGQVPKDVITKMHAALVLQQDGELIEFIPDHAQDEQIRLLAVQATPSAFAKVKEKNYEIYLAAAKGGNPLERVSIPMSYLTRDLCEALVLADWKNLNRVPGNVFNKKMCDDAVEQSPSALKDVPNSLHNYERCYSAIKKGGELRHVPPRFRDLELCLEALLIDGDSIEHVPQELKTKEMLALAKKMKNNTPQSEES